MNNIQKSVIYYVTVAYVDAHKVASEDGYTNVICSMCNANSPPDCTDISVVVVVTD